MTNEQTLTEEYKKLTSPKSVEEAGRILLSLGKEIESRFPGVKFYLKARFKSPHSFREKVKKMKDNDQNDEKTIYDMIGFRLVIENVENDFQFSQKRCKNLVEKKRKLWMSYLS
ncbi:MAG: hypothetical protein J6A89_04880 [Clostridia bacterium]|nr:hypothetical protein [Clostridia bacterium]